MNLRTAHFFMNIRELICFGFFLLVVYLFSVSCQDSTKENGQKYVQGQIMVGLNQECPYDTAIVILKQPRVDILDLAYWFKFYYSGSNPDSIIGTLDENDGIEFVGEENPRDMETPGDIRIIFWTKSVYSELYYLDIIRSLGDIDSEIAIEAELAIIEVPVGKEEHYVEVYKSLSRLKEYISFVTLNPIAEPEY